MEPSILFLQKLQILADESFSDDKASVVYGVASALIKNYAPCVTDEMIASDPLEGGVMLPLCVRLLGDDFQFFNTASYSAESIKQAFARTKTEFIEPFKPFLNRYRKVKVV